MQCIPRHLQPTIVESALCCPCLELLFSLSSQTACTQCTFSTLPGVIVPGTGSQPSYTASPNRLRFTLQQKIEFAAQLGCTLSELCCTLRATLHLLSYTAPFWATLHPTWPMMRPKNYAPPSELQPSELCCILLSYAASFWVMLHPTELRLTLNELCGTLNI